MMKDSRFSSGQAYVGFSRVKAYIFWTLMRRLLKQLSDDVKNEMARLNDRILSPLSVYTSRRSHHHCNVRPNYQTLNVTNCSLQLWFTVLLASVPGSFFSNWTLGRKKCFFPFRIFRKKSAWDRGYCFTDGNVVTVSNSNTWNPSVY